MDAETDHGSESDDGSSDEEESEAESEEKEEEDVEQDTIIPGRETLKGDCRADFCC
jgi:hypothetical protein